MIIEVSIEDAISSLGKFRDEHIADYKEALGKWREAMAKYAKELEAWTLSDVQVGATRPHEPNRPRNYLGEYDKIIAKLGRHQKETIELNDNEYSNIFEDSFYWKTSFISQINGATITGGSISSSHIRSASISSLNADSIDGYMSGSDKRKLDGHVPLEDEDE